MSYTTRKTTVVNKPNKDVEYIKEKEENTKYTINKKSNIGILTAVTYEMAKDINMIKDDMWEFRSEIKELKDRIKILEEENIELKIKLNNIK